MATKNNANLPNLEPFMAAGIDPKTGLPYKMGGAAQGLNLKQGILQSLRILDQQNATNRFTWYNLPKGITPQMIERILYFKGQGAFFYIDTAEQFYFLPYALNGTIDCYGRYTVLLQSHLPAARPMERTKTSHLFKV
jgi:hypothetical protein